MSVTRTNYITDTSGFDAPNMQYGELHTQIATPSAPASGSNRLYFKSDNALHTMAYGGTEATYIAAASGSNGQYLMKDSNVSAGHRFVDPYYKNYIVESDAEIGAASGWTTYADSAANIPVDGTGGSPNSTWAATGSSPLNGSYSYIWTKSGSANRQGEGVAYPFTIDSADQGQVLSVAFNYQLASGTFVASDGVTAPLNDGTTSTNSGNSDLEVFIYDVTNAQLIYVTPEVLLSNSTTVANQFKGIFQAPSNSTSYRLLIHTATTSTSNYVMKFDRFYVGPQQILQGPALGDWTSYSLTIGATTTPPTKGTIVRDNAQWRRVGDSMQIRYDYQQSAAGSNGSGAYLFPLPSGYSIDTSKFAAPASTATFPTVGNAFVWTDEGTDFALSGTISIYNSTNLFIVGNYNTTGGGNAIFDNVGSSFKLGNASTYILTFIATVPIAGWSSNNLISNDASTRVVAARYTNSAQSFVSGTATLVQWQNKTYDTHGAFSGSTYTVPVSGIYRIEASAQFQPFPNTPNYAILFELRVNGSTVASKEDSGTVTSSYYVFSSQFVTDYNLKAGDTVQIRLTQSNNGGVTYSFGSSDNSYFNINQVQGPSSITSVETVSCRYRMTSDDATDTTNPVNYDSKIWDTHSAVTTGATTWKFTAPISGYYHLSVGGYSNSAAPTLRIYKNGTLYSALFTLDTARYQNGGLDIDLLAGDYIDVRAASSVTLTTDSASGYPNHINIYRIR